MKKAIAALAIFCASSAGATTVRVHYDAGKDGIAIFGDQRATAQGVRANVWSYSWPDRLGDITMKPALGGKPSTGGAYRIAAGASADIYPFFGPSAGKVTILPAMASPQLGNSRPLRVYLPPSYRENLAKRYPVLYVQDGQNLFDAATAAYGTEWGIDETVDRLVGAGVMDEVIVVGIDNTPDRIAEYTPCCDPKHGGGKLDAYASFVVDTVKPAIDKMLRTLPGRGNSAIMGSSLGGIAAVAIAQRSPDVFAQAASLSGSFWWNERALVNAAARVPVRFYLDAGTSDDGLEDTMEMREAMLRLGYREGIDLSFYRAEGGAHNEASWAARVAKPLAWLFPWGGAKY